MTYQIERQRAAGSWTLHRGGQKFKDSDAAWEMLYQTMAWRPGMRLRLRAFRKDPYESAATPLRARLEPASTQVKILATRKRKKTPDP
jgi:hypothetical protein